MTRIRIIETEVELEALLDETHETACYFDAETNDFQTITSDAFEVLGEAEEEVVENYEEPTQEAQPMLTLANVLGGRLKSLTVEFK
jgi:uncharacterized tellurite resistance protein B-like protein